MNRPTENLLKQHKIETNFGGKMANPRFIHIDLAPGDLIPESELQRTIFEIIAKDGSYPPVQVQLHDLARFPVARIWTLPDHLAWSSHQMSTQQLATWFEKKYLQWIHSKTECAIYYYSKI